MNKKLRTLLFGVFAAATLLGCSPSEKERMTITALTTNMKSHCVGRFLIDMPQGFEHGGVSPQSGRFLPPDMDFQEAPQMTLELRATGQSEAQFKNDIDRIIAANSVPVQYQNDFALLAHTEKTSTNGVLIRLYDKLGKDSGYYTTFVHFLLNGFHVIARSDSHDGKFESTEKHLKEFVRNIKVYDPSKAEKGFCVGPLLIQGRYSGEQMNFGFTSNKFLDLRVGLMMDTYREGNSSTLLQRANDPKNLLNLFDVSYSTLRKGRREVAGMQGQELAVRFSGNNPDDDSTMIEHKLMLEVDRKTPSESQPFMDFGITTGGQDPSSMTTGRGKYRTSSLSDAELMALWDAIVNSIRLRPGAV